MHYHYAMPGDPNLEAVPVDGDAQRTAISTLLASDRRATCRDKSTSAPSSAVSVVSRASLMRHVSKVAVPTPVLCTSCASSQPRAVHL